MKKTALVIMAAGIGSRFGEGIKQLTPVDDYGHVIMDYSVYDAIEAGFNECLLIRLQTLDFTDFCPIFWYNNCKDFDENNSFFLQFSYRF